MYRTSLFCPCTVQALLEYLLIYIMQDLVQESYISIKNNKIILITIGGTSETKFARFTLAMGPAEL